MPVLFYRKFLFLVKISQLLSDDILKYFTQTISYCLLGDIYKILL